MPKVVPMRMCAQCRTSKPKNELCRVVRSPEGDISLDTTGRKPGRGAYLCKSTLCLEKARKSKVLERTLGTISPEVYEGLAASMEEQS